MVGTRPEGRDAIVLKVNKVSARVRLVGEEGEVTFRTRDHWRLVPGHVAEVEITKRWTHRGASYASGRVRRTRIDVDALGLEPLPVEDSGEYAVGELSDAYYEPEDEREPIPPRPRRAVEMHAIVWEGRRAFERNDLDDCPVSDAAKLKDGGDLVGARKLLNEVLHDDLRCIDAHAHLGNLEFDLSAERALVHYELGIRIGARMLRGHEDAMLLWADIHNRPYHRCLYGYGLCLWRLDRRDEAVAIFERMLQLPTDPRDASVCIDDLRRGLSWDDASGVT